MGASTGLISYLYEKLYGKTLDPKDANVAEDIKRIKNLPDEEKLRLMDNAFETVGGGLGALAGGGTPASLAGAGAGAVLGRSASRLTGKAFGLKEQPRTAGEEATEIGTTFATNAIGEGVGRAIPAAVALLPKKIKQLPLRAIGAPKATVDAVRESTATTAIKNKLRELSEQTPEAKTLSTLADKYGVELNWGQRSGQPWLQAIEVSLDRNPFTTGKVRAFRKKQYNQYEGQINNYLESLHKGEISLEDFARMTEGTFSDLQRQFNQRVGAGAQAASKQLNPAAVSDVEAGVGLRTGIDRNEAAVAKWAEREYGGIRKKYGMHQINMMPLGRQAQEILRDVPPGQLQNIMPPSAMSIIRSANVKPSLEDIPLVEMEAARMNGWPTPTREKTPPLVSMTQAMKIISDLRQRAAKMTSPDMRPYQRNMYQLADAVTASMEESLGQVPGAEKAVANLKSVNAQYRQHMEKLRAPLSPGKPGSTAAPIIANTNVPEQIPAQVAASPTMLRQTGEAVTPGMAGGPTNAVDPMQLLRRNRFDATTRAATITDPATGYNRLSPTRMSQEMPDPDMVQALYGRQAPQVSGLMKPGLVAREQLLYNSPLAKTRDSATSVFNTAFPKKGFGGNLDNTMAVFNEAGQVPQAKRAFGQELFTRSETPVPSVDDVRRVNPRTLEKKAGEYGETVPRVLGPTAPKRIQEFVDIGKGITGAEQQYGNPSGTGRFMQLMKVIGDVTSLDNLNNPVKNIGNVVGHAKAAMLTADRFTDPARHKWAFDPPEKLIGMGGAPSGTVGRVGLSLSGNYKPSSMPREDDLGPEVGEDSLGPVVENEDDLGPIVSTPVRKPK